MTQGNSDLFGHGLYDPREETDACGFGLIAHLDGQASRALVDSALTMLKRMTHRGAVAADGLSGDGCGILLSLPRAFFRDEMAAQDVRLPERFAVGQLFIFNTDAAVRRAVDEFFADERWPVQGWRQVPTRPDVVGENARSRCPEVWQFFLGVQTVESTTDVERRLYAVRRKLDSVLGRSAYIVSLSSQRIGYKGLVLPANLDAFFPELADVRLRSCVAVVHQRFSTNTSPDWRLAQPFRLLAHNGEINTIAGNRAWARARSGKFASGPLSRLDIAGPQFDPRESDSASFDAMIEFLIANGMPLDLSLRVLMPPAWQNVTDIRPEVRSFFQFYSLNVDPWDGPACIVLTDGVQAAAATDRNGLRPARWALTENRHLVLASEAGVMDLPARGIVRKGRLGPGDLLTIDTRTGALRTTEVIDAELAKAAPFQRWIREAAVRLETDLTRPKLLDHALDDHDLAYQERLFDLGFEEQHQVIKVLAGTGKEAVGSMGDDSPVGVMSGQFRPLYDYFRQRFAQVTNPPIDPLRENIVMSLETNFGPETGFFNVGPEQAKRVIAESPLLSEAKFRRLVDEGYDDLPVARVSLALSGSETLFQALNRLNGECEKAAEEGARILLLSDEAGADNAHIHALLAVGAVHQYLARSGRRCDINIVIATGTARDPHQVACLLAAGATAVYPWLAYQSIAGMVRRGDIRPTSGRSAEEEMGFLGRAYRKGINAGLYKILSKMGISTMWSYRGARLFEILGLADEVVDLCFDGAESAQIGGADFGWLERQAREQLARAQSEVVQIVPSGRHKFSRGGDYHAWHPGVVHGLQKATETGRREDYDEYARLVNERPAMSLRDLLRIRSDREPINVDDVESEQDIVVRFESAGMSLGALSPEAHESLALAMNRLGGRSNSGEGGEDPARNGTDRQSKIRQVASGRFGVTAYYLNHAEVIQIKMAQGAKPGEGGQLPGHKVNDQIARLRYAKPGIGLISPPPHHDIYSIEDLAQLIYDLKEVNPTALIAVKLVARRGIGTIAVGVAKAHADIITVSGYDGGTGASPLTSVKYAGSPWELGLAEVQQALVANGLRERVRLQVDGGLKTGLDVVKAALLGAGTFGFGTAPMVALGCKYLRICHLNNCATGVATQNEELREKHFHGSAERVERFFRFIAVDVRERLAAIGAKTVREIIGRSELLEQIEGETEQQHSLDLRAMLADASIRDAKTSRKNMWARNRRLHKSVLAERIAAETFSVVDRGAGGSFSYPVNNSDRAIGANLAGKIARSPEPYTDSIHLRLTGSAGQSLGAWCVEGLSIDITGECNDYVGKGMNGGRISVRPPEDAGFDTRYAPIVGNVCLYGATGGHLYASGSAGERFAVRNSGATAVVQGVGDHACEYMTGGVVAVLGPTGRNFGAGMTGGFAYVLDQDRLFVDRYNTELIDIERIMTESMEAHVYYLRELLQDHVRYTGSEFAQELVTDLRDYLPYFWLVKPKATQVHELIDTLNRAA